MWQHKIQKHTNWIYDNLGLNMTLNKTFDLKIKMIKKNKMISLNKIWRTLKQIQKKCTNINTRIFKSINMKVQDELNDLHWTKI